LQLAYNLIDTGKVGHVHNYSASFIGSQLGGQPLEPRKD
jgi:hypothetical protein